MLDALNLYGATLLQGRQAARALEYLQRAAHLKRSSPGIVANLAQRYFVLKRYDEASEAFRKASRRRSALFALSTRFGELSAQC